MQEAVTVDLNDPQLFINRELSWLAFNERVLADVREASLPIYERLKFFAITSSNLDEFFMVRVAGLKQQLASGVAETAADGMLPADQLVAIGERVHSASEEMYRLWREELLPKLASHGVAVLTRDKLTAEQKAAAKTFFTSSVFPALTPLAVDPGHPFPHLRNKSLNVAILLRREGPRRRRNAREKSLAVVQVPSVLSRLAPVPASSGTVLAVLPLEELIALCAGELFPGYAVEQSAAFRVTRNWDLNVDEEESADLLSTLQEELRRRDRGAAVRLELEAAASMELETALTGALKLGTQDVYRLNGPMQPSDLMALTDLDPRPELRVEPFVPATPPVLRDEEPVLSLIAKRDILLHHPYESFDPVVRFLEEAAEDPNVLAIKQTLYRTSGDSPIARALTRAVENGKQVAVLVEIKARLDEANNIAWARRMEESGVHVVYGLIGLKTHCKVALVVRREGNGIRRYVHLGTGNYNPTTARLYTDLSLFTARQEIAEDVTALFNMLTGYSTAPQWKRLAVAPMGLHEKVLGLIQREADKARKGEPARIVAKMNSLVDPSVIRALYAASQAGVRIDLLVRGICCLRPGVPGVSENIQVTSVVDRFLEHSRVFAFGEGAQAEVWASSADWMPRNFVRRIETMFPVEEPLLRQRLLDEVLGVALRDNAKARRLQRDGTYVPVERTGSPVRSQMVLLELARRVADSKPIESLMRHVAAPEIPAEPLRVPATPVPSTG
ncbi:polyphosphate kinase 1 [Stigmatella aurantiaca]|uniref:Polyphosphate kinase n=1 Tax=Stigmatella aurantiaca (strain DW4/3-1) TaxID=378806 RepID=Q09EC6_STIAD|nr:polyphosphate kinase 1 [Stigmatella aurantiaca]ADO74666.1 Ppk protein [Stigmatella aurantiaca DW4/3-1]EAU70090.1 polyphosphate kinase [Stigmatella aurantiaca DW4/3-1]